MLPTQMRFLEINNLRCIRWHLKRMAVPDKILVCVDDCYTYIMHCRKDDWPCPLIRINTYEDNWKEKLYDAMQQLTPNSLVIANDDIIKSLNLDPEPMEIVN